MLSEGEKDIINKLEQIKVNVEGILYNFEASKILGLITKLQKENEVLKRAFDKQSGDIGNYLVELQQKDKQIDLMVKHIYDSNEEYCSGRKCNKELNCIKCIKQYFEKQAKEKGE